MYSNHAITLPSTPTSDTMADGFNV